MRKRKNLKSSILFLVLSLLSLSAYGQGKQLCVGKLEYLKGDASGGRSFRDDTIFTISIGGSKIKLGKNESKTLELPVDVQGKYITIKKNDKPYTSIKYRPKYFKSSKICMWLYWPHATWQMSDYEKGKHGCGCV